MVWEKKQLLYEHFKVSKDPVGLQASGKQGMNKSAGDFYSRGKQLIVIYPSFSVSALLTIWAR